MVKIRLQRHGRKKRPYYHLVAADVRARRDGRIVEDLGRVNPGTNPRTVTMNVERVIYWIKNGAEPTKTVLSILKQEGIFYRLHLERWGKSAEEIESTISAWKEAKGTTKPQSASEIKKAALVAEAAAVAKAEEEAAKAAAKQAKAKAEAAEAEPVVEEAPAAETETATEEGEAQN